MKRVHIIGPPRSGTTLMLELMITGFQFSMVSKNEISILYLPEYISQDAIICTKNPQDHRLIKYIIEKDSCLWFISMVRDPRDVVVSRHGKRPDVYWSNLRQWKEWLKNTRTYKWHPNLIEVRYEELVKSPDDIQNQLVEHMPFLRKTCRFSEYHKFARPSRQSLEAMRNVRPVNDASVENWRQHLARIAGQLKIHGMITQELIDLGYEKDDEWLKLLDGITPDTRPGLWPEFLPSGYVQKIRKQLEARSRIYLQKRGLL